MVPTSGKEPTTVRQVYVIDDQHMIYRILMTGLSGKSTKTHLYWSMKNCNGDADELRRRIQNIVTHYKVLWCYIYVHVYPLHETFFCLEFPG